MNGSQPGCIELCDVYWWGVAGCNLLPVSFCWQFRLQTVVSVLAAV